MKKSWLKSCGIALYCVAACLILVCKSYGEDDFIAFINRQPLKGIKSVYLIVSKVNDDIAKDGLDQDAIQKSMENKLLEAHIRLTDFREYMSAGGTAAAPATLWVKIETLKVENQPTYVYSVTVEVSEAAKQIHPPYQQHSATVWEQHTIGYCGTQRAAAIKDDCDKFMDEFVNEWLKVQNDPSIAEWLKEHPTKK